MRSLRPQCRTYLCRVHNIRTGSLYSSLCVLLFSSSFNYILMHLYVRILRDQTVIYMGGGTRVTFADFGRSKEIAADLTWPHS